MSWPARQLLASANELLDERPKLLRAAGTIRGFHDGARWMRLVMNSIRKSRLEHAPRLTVSFESLGWRKYLVCLTHSLIWLVILRSLRVPWVVVIGVAFFAFYVAESFFVFAFPRRVDSLGLSDFTLVKIAGGVHRIVWTIMAIAGYMLGGGFTGHGFVRSWCVGCAAVVIWYEHARLASPQHRI